MTVGPHKEANSVLISGFLICKAADLAREKELEMVNFFRNIMLTGALFGFAKFVAKDRRVVG